MVATPEAAQILMKGVNGQMASESFTTTDANGGYWTVNSNGQKFFIMPFRGWIVDMSMATGGTDTKTISLYVNSRDTGIRLILKGLVVSINNRLAEPIPIEAGSMIQFLEHT